VFRHYHHNEITFSLMYAFSENFVLPLSHDEVVHGKGSLLGKMPGDEWNKFAGLRALFAYMWAHPGKQLLFMGSEFGQGAEWSADRGVDWWVLGDEHHAGMQQLVTDLNRAYRENPALWALDYSPSGFGWIDANDAAGNVLSFLRFSGEQEGPAPGAEAPPSGAPGGKVPDADPGGATPGASPGGAAPGASPAGAAPAASPGGAAPGASPAGAAPGASPAGAVPAASPGGAAPRGELAPGGEAAPGGADTRAPQANPGVLACIINFSGQPHPHYQVGLPRAGRWREIVNTDAFGYGGSGVGNLGAVEAVPEPCHGQPASAVMTLPPLGALWLVPED
jgi:1,4-alpha-glucan branching enzyme